MQRTAAQSGKTGRKIVAKSESNLVTRSVHLPYFFDRRRPRIVAGQSGALSEINATLE